MEHKIGRAVAIRAK